jgi:hypothetical protein
MATEYKYKDNEELLQLLPGATGGKLFGDDDESFPGSDAAPLASRLGEPRNGNGHGKGLNSPEDIEQTADLVKIYLREMGSILLLSREQEISLARRMERGEKAILKALIKTPVTLDELVALEAVLKKTPEAFVKHFNMAEDSFTEDSLEDRRREVLARIHKIKVLCGRLMKVRPLVRNRFARGRMAVRIIRMTRELELKPEFQDRTVRRSSPASRRTSRSSPSRPARTSGASCRRSSPAAGPGSGPRATWSRPTCAWSCPSPRSTRAGASSSST